MSIALHPIVKAYHLVDSGYADSAALKRNNPAYDRETVELRVSRRYSTTGLQLFYALSTLTLTASLLVSTVWLFCGVFVTMITRLQSLDTIQLMHALAGQ